MKIIRRIILVLCLSCALLAGCSTSPAPSDTGTGTAEPERLSVVASFYSMYDFASKIGGDKISLVTLVPAGTEPHDWEPSAADIAALENAAVFIYNGAGMEHWVSDILESLENKNLLATEVSAGIALLEGQHEHEEDAAEAEHADETGHEENNNFDPHVWLNPMYAKVEMANIKNALIQADPTNKDYYEANYIKYAGALDALDNEFKVTLSALPSKDIIVAHQAFGYLCDAYGLNQVAIEGLSADSEPDPARMGEIIEFAQTHNIKVIFFEELVSPAVAETIAAAIGAKTDVLNPLEGLTDAQLAAGDDYFSVMRQNLQALKAALES